jgi:hypothetical protein
MAPTHQDLEIRQGSTFSFSFVAKDIAGSPIDLTGYSARMSIKRDLRSTETSYLATSSGTNGTISLGTTNGLVTISMTAAQTDIMDESDWFYWIMSGEPELPLDPYVEFLYDLELVSGAGVVSCPIQGKVNLWRAVTR